MTQPAASCRCTRPGTPSPDQRNVASSMAVNYKSGNRQAIRFHCNTCGHIWTTNLDDALAHGRFLQRAQLGAS